MRPAQVPEELLGKAYCPSCGQDLGKTECPDPFASCLACASDHRFYFMPDPPAALETASASSLVFAELEGRDPEEVALFWLSEPAARRALNPQLAELLRALLETRHVPSERPHSYCPLCAGLLSKYEQPDIWVRGLQCPRGHSWASRGNRLAGIAGQGHIDLHSESSDAVVTQLASYWIRSDSRLCPQLHESVRHALAIGWPTAGGAA